MPPSLITPSPAIPSLAINVLGGFGEADENTLEVDIKDNTVADNGDHGIRVRAGQENRSTTTVVALIRGNTVRGPRLRGSMPCRSGSDRLPDRHQ